MDTKRTDDQLSDAEADKRMNDALRRALKTPPKPHKESSPNAKNHPDKKATK